MLWAVFRFLLKLKSKILWQTECKIHLNIAASLKLKAVAHLGLPWCYIFSWVVKRIAEHICISHMKFAKHLAKIVMKKEKKSRDLQRLKKNNGRDCLILSASWCHHQECKVLESIWFHGTLRAHVHFPNI